MARISVSCMAAVLCLCGCTQFESGDASTPAASRNWLIVGQDLSAIRGYMGSECCLAPDALTAYVDFYDILSQEGGFGGLGLDTDGNPIELEADWGGGPGNAFKTATTFGVSKIAIGLSLTENQHPGGLDQLVAGQFDSQIAHLALFAKRIPGSIYLRIGYEFDGAWNVGYENAPRYVAAYRRIVDGIRANGVRNVAFVWQGAASTTDVVLDEGRLDDIADWYPGDDYVDWVGLSWFMHPDAQPDIKLTFSVPSPRELADQVLALARRHGKAVMIAEASPQGFDLRDRQRSFHSPVWDGPAGTGTTAVTDQQIWDEWFAPLFAYMDANNDVVRALAYINVRWDDQDLWDSPYESGYWGDSRLEVNPYIAERFNQAIEHWRGQHVK